MAKDCAEVIPSRTRGEKPAAQPGLPVPLLLGVVLVGGAVFAQMRWGVLDQILPPRPKPAAESSAPEPKAEEPHVRRPQIARSSARHREQRVIAQVRRGAESVPENAPSPPAAAQRRFPTGTDIEPGMSGLSIRQAFGAPDMRMTGSEHGRPVEHWVYVSHGSEATTTVLLSDNKAVSADTSPSQ